MNPFNGEGIAYAMESAALAAEYVLQALGRADGPSREAALQGYATAMKDHLGAYYRLGGMFSTLIGHPSIMKTATRLGSAAQAADVSGAQAAGRAVRQPGRRLGGQGGPHADQGGAQCLTGLLVFVSAAETAAAGRNDVSAYLPIIILLVVAGGFAVTNATVVTDLLGPKRFNRAKLDAYECGIEPTPLPPGPPVVFRSSST